MLFQPIEYLPQVFCMLYNGTGKYKDVICKDDDEIIQISTEDALYQVHELQRGIGNPEGHYQKLVGSLWCGCTTRVHTGLIRLLTM